MFLSIQASPGWDGKFSRTFLGWEWGREERLPGLFVGECGGVESLLRLLVGEGGADLQISGGRGGGHLDPETRGGGKRSRASVWSKNKGGLASS